MKKMKKKILWVLSLLLVGLFSIQCNTGVDGFNAPAGSEVALPEDGTITVTDGVSMVYFWIDFSVLVPFEFEGEEEKVPGGSINAFSVCTNCIILDAPPGQDIRLLDPSEMEDKGETYVYSTNDRGFKTLVAALVSPSTLGIKEYEAVFSVSLGVSGDQMKITVKLAEEDEGDSGGEGG